MEAAVLAETLGNIRLYTRLKPERCLTIYTVVKQ